MKKKLISISIKVSTTVLIMALLTALLLNISTLWSVGAIKRGESLSSGYFSTIIISGSMEPTVMVNDLLLVKCDASYQTEDIITYVSPQGSLVTHRIKEVSDQGYVTQGDANNIPDVEISRKRVLGKVVFILPGVGGIIGGILSPAGVILLGCICLLLWLLQRIRRDQYEDEQNISKDSFIDSLEN